MDALTFIAEIVKALAWPLAALAVAVLFRTELRALMGRVRKGKVGPAEFEFEQVVASLRERIGPAERTTPAVGTVTIDQATSDPRSVILNSWLQVQALVETIVARHATADERKDPRSVSLRVLHRLLRDKPEYIDMYNDLRALRSQAVHDVAFAPRPGSVVEFAELANELQTVLRPYAR
jgi:hypothetical protein